jgi:hypothetical protein
MLTEVTRLEKLEGFRLRVRFSEGEHDFAPMVNDPSKLSRRSSNVCRRKR